jgi:hypothetical protein
MRFVSFGFRYWEIVDCVEKLLLTSVLAFFPTVAQLPIGRSVLSRVLVSSLESAMLD